MMRIVVSRREWGLAYADGFPSPPADTAPHAVGEGLGEIPFDTEGIPAVRQDAEPGSQEPIVAQSAPPPGGPPFPLHGTDSHTQDTQPLQSD